MCDLMTQLSRLSSAEDFLSFLSIPFDQRVVNVNRLHIMKRFGAVLATFDPAFPDEDAVRAALLAAYHEFETTGAQPPRLFKVFANGPVTTKSVPQYPIGCRNSHFSDQDRSRCIPLFRISTPLSVRPRLGHDSLGGAVR
ncbi:MAG: nitrogenase-stabilizing/protective protein NifW [Alphaproteobacteria bacterium]